MDVLEAQPEIRSVWLGNLQPGWLAHGHSAACVRDLRS
jgi:hypothetical protein